MGGEGRGGEGKGKGTGKGEREGREAGELAPKHKNQTPPMPLIPERFITKKQVIYKTRKSKFSMSPG
jgi:hypothetical protein